MRDIGKLRKDFTAHPPLRRKDMADEPFAQFADWLDDALDSALEEPNAFILATVDNAGRASQRTVLLRYFDPQGFVFYTNYTSRKAQEIAKNPRVSMLFPWYRQQRQVSVEGEAEKVPSKDSLKYFLSRPRDSQLGAWSSPQSRVIESRDFLMLQWQHMKDRFRSGKVPLPGFWGGYRIRPSAFEFWQGQANRLHDRFRYHRENGCWRVSRLAP